MTLMTAFLILLYALALPYIALMGLVVVGLVRSGRQPRSSDRPSVSVVIPAHNEEDKLAATLASLAEQRYDGPLEFVIVDDRSTDATAEIIRSFVGRDARFRLVSVRHPDRRLSPKVNAVDTGIRASTGEILLTSDADCRYPEGWVSGMVSHFEPDVAMVVGYVESTRAYRARSWVERFESIDWLSLMLTSKALTRFGWKFASSANNQAYRRDAFEAIGGFGASGRAPSGDEDLLTQRMGRLPDKRVVFASSPETRVLTQPMPSFGALLRQRRRWVSRYHHPIHYHPGFLASIAVLGFQSVALAAGVLALPFAPAMAPWVLGLWAAEIAVELVGMAIGTAQVERRDLWGWPTLVWGLLHPFFIATVVIWSLVKPGHWRTQSYRRRFFQRQWRELRRRLRTGLSDL